MIDHTGFVVTDLARARRFYDAIARPLGLITREIGKEAFFVGRDAADQPVPYLWIGTLRPSYWVEGSRPGINQVHVAFKARDQQAVEEFYTAGIAAGGRDNGPPGARPNYGNYYAAFVLDPDGNNIEAVYHGEGERSAASVTIRF